MRGEILSGGRRVSKVGGGGGNNFSHNLVTKIIKISVSVPGDHLVGGGGHSRVLIKGVQILVDF